MSSESNAENLLWKQLLVATKEKKDRLLQQFSERYAIHIDEIRDRKNPSGQIICPRCNKTGTISGYGFFDSAKQRRRYYCKPCNLHFNDFTGTLFHKRKLHNHIIPFLRIMLEGTPVRTIAKELNISPTTAHKWRHLVLQYIERYMADSVASLNTDSEVLMETSLREFNPSHKGLHDQSNSVVPYTQRIYFHSDRLGRNYASLILIDILKTNRQLIRAETSISLKGKHLSSVNSSLASQRALQHTRNVQAFQYKFDEMHKRMRGVAQPYLNRYLQWNSFVQQHCMLNSGAKIRALIFACL
ncbi:hypothetical protein [Paenibacillus silvisoli]|uniref:hypothetical protein n=1 Tax=Paenibacillus silvisoli TaxID=3110539 RepID=UPI002804373F|nr:hypothetical protein [Paenibacillus silvisoli]